jgi:hypothetical protein
MDAAQLIDDEEAFLAGLRELGRASSVSTELDAPIGIVSDGVVGINNSRFNESAIYNLQIRSGQ